MMRLAFWLVLLCAACLAQDMTTEQAFKSLKDDGAAATADILDHDGVRFFLLGKGDLPDPGESYWDFGLVGRLRILMLWDRLGPQAYNDVRATFIFCDQRATKFEKYGIAMIFARWADFAGQYELVDGKFRRTHGRSWPYLRTAGQLEKRVSKFPVKVKRVVNEILMSDPFHSDAERQARAEIVYSYLKDVPGCVALGVVASGRNRAVSRLVAKMALADARREKLALGKAASILSGCADRDACIEFARAYIAECCKSGQVREIARIFWKFGEVEDVALIDSKLSAIPGGHHAHFSFAKIAIKDRERRREKKQ